tara:strand:- start:711 stop:1046 length:336 start_codon:yes stop_codon:yes gene_type:complete
MENREKWFMVLKERLGDIFTIRDYLDNKFGKGEWKSLTGKGRKFQWQGEAPNMSLRVVMRPMNLQNPKIRINVFKGENMVFPFMPTKSYGVSGYGDIGNIIDKFLEEVKEE